MNFLSSIQTKVIVFFLKELRVVAADEIVLLETGIANLVAAIKGGTDWETAVTTELNTLFQGEATEGKKIVGSFLDFVAKVAKKLHI